MGAVVPPAMSKSLGAATSLGFEAPPATFQPRMSSMINTFASPVSQWMVSPVFTIREKARLAEAASLFTELRVSALPVLDSSSRLTGIISRSDLMQAGRFVRESREEERRLRLPEVFVSELTNSRVPVIRRDLALSDCARRMVKQQIYRLYVAEDGPLEGVISTREMQRAVAEARIETPLDVILTRTVEAVPVECLLSTATARLFADPSLTLVVTRGRVPVGLFSGQEAAVAREADPTDCVELWMDGSVLSLPGQTPLYVAAERAYETRCRYIVAHEGADDDATLRVTGFTSGMGFAQIVAEHANRPARA
jgi:CBS domain-containing protein